MRSPRRTPCLPALAGGLTLLALAGGARASVADVFGLGAAEVGAGDAAVAVADDFAACHYNPAGLAAADRRSLHLGYAVADARLTVGGRAHDLDHAGGLTFGVAVPLELPLSWLPRIAFGLALYAPPDVVVAVHGRAPDTAALPYYDDRLARWLVLPALALRFPAGVSLGVAVDVFAGLRGPVTITEGPTGAAEGRAVQELYGTATPLVGLRWDALDWLSLGVVYRAAFSAPVATASSADAGGARVQLDASIDGLYRPHAVVVGAAFRGAGWHVALDLSWERWSGFRGALFDVAAELQGIGISAEPVELPLADAFGARLGGELRRPLGGVELAVRGGYGYESRILPEGVEGAARLDGDKHVLSTGLGLARRAADGTALTLDVFFAAHLLAGASAVAPGIGPGATAEPVTAEGAVLATGVTLGVEW